MRYGIGATTNDLEEAEKALEMTDHRILNILGIVNIVEKDW